MIMFLGRKDDRELHEKISKRFVIDMNSYKSSQMIIYVWDILLSFQIVRFS